MTERPARKADAKSQRTHPKTKPASAKSPQIDQGKGKRQVKSSAVARSAAPRIGAEAVITNSTTKREKPAITSDRWHVVHSQWMGKKAGNPPFARHIVSEHADKAAALIAAKKLAARLNATMGDRPAEDRDQLLVRRPGFRSLKFRAARTRSRPR